jgi:hypothetical protein
MSRRVDFEYLLRFPYVEQPHETLIAFMRTSEYGVWDFHPDLEMGPFNLYFIRGNWRPPALGIFSRTPLLCSRNSFGDFIANTKPMRLEVLMRPSGPDYHTRLKFAVYSPNVVGIHEIEYYIEYWKSITRSESQSLCRHIERSFMLHDGAVAFEIN